MESRQSQHAQARIRQRGFRDSDPGFVMEYGTDVYDGFLLTKKDVQRGIEECKKAIGDLERLKGTVVILAEDTVVSIYRPDKRRTRRLLDRRPI